MAWATQREMFKEVVQKRNSQLRDLLEGHDEATE